MGYVQYYGLNISPSYILYGAAQIWTAIEQTYLQSDNDAEFFDVHQRLVGLKQGNLL